MVEQPIALVTGANTGIGRATAECLASNGYRVLCTGRRLGAIEDAARAIDASGERALGVELDICVPSSVETLLTRLPPQWRDIEVLVNNAGHDRGGRQRFHEIAPADFRDVIQTNLLGLIAVTHAVIQGMVERNRGHIVNVGSIQGFTCYPKATVYTASKFGIRGFSECLRMDYVNTPIRVTEVAPGLVQSSFAANRWDDAERAAEFYAGFAARLQPEDVAAGVLYALAQPAHVDVAQVILQPGGRS